jgi:indole-3-glycerol phosphate synthase
MCERRDSVLKTALQSPLSALKSAVRRRKHHSLRRALESRASTRIIAEVKKASPSAGLISRRYDPAATACLYRSGGAVGVSVLTEPRHFLGSVDDLRKVRSAVSLPLLRKDFICDPYQIWESAACGADAVLLIVAALDDSLLRTLYEEALRCRLEVVAEAHTRAELHRALDLEEAIVGVNSRNLSTMKCDLSVTRHMGSAIPRNRLCIAESGIRGRADVLRLERQGYDAFLVGSALMCADDPESKLRELTGNDNDGKD